MSSAVEERVIETLRQVRTAHDRIMTREAITILEGSLYRKDKEATNKILADNLSENLYQTVRKILSDEQMTAEEALREYFTRLNERLRKMKTLQFEVMFAPDEQLILEITDWISRELGADFVVDFNLNPAIVGGAVIIYEGEYFDFTLSVILEKNFEKSWDEITKEYSIV